MILEARIMAHDPRSVGDGDADRLQVPGRDVDDQPLDLAVRDPDQLVGDVPDMPVLPVGPAGSRVASTWR